MKIFLLLIIAGLGLFQGQIFLDNSTLSKPGRLPSIFLPGIVSTGEMEHSGLSISSESGEMFFARETGNNNSIYFTRFIDDKFIEPELLNFSGRYFDTLPIVKPNGKTLFFSSNRPIGEIDSFSKNFDIWYVVRNQNTDWGEPVNIGTPINTTANEISLSLNADNSIYFASDRDNGFGGFDLYISEMNNGLYVDPINLGDSINTPYHETSPCISPDGSFLLFDAYGRDTGNGIYISFKKDDGDWSKAIILDKVINSTGTERFSSLSNDGRFLFFNSMRKIDGVDSTSFGNGLGDIYWIDNSIIKSIYEETL